MKVLHLNNPAQVASNLVFAQRELGIDANLAITGNKNLHDNYDYDLSTIPTKYFQGKFELGRRLYGLIKDCDILHYHGQAISAGYRDLILWAGIMNKPVVLHYHGSEISNKTPSKFTNDFVKHIYVSTPDLLKSVPDAEWLPNPTNLEKIVYSDLDINEKLVILHAPSNRKIKNTQAVIDSIEVLKEEGIEVELNLAENIEHEKLMRMIAQSHVVIDWVNPDFGIYGVLSIESMATGRVFPRPFSSLISITVPSEDPSSNNRFPRRYRCARPIRIMNSSGTPSPVSFTEVGINAIVFWKSWISENNAESKPCSPNSPIISYILIWKLFLAVEL